VDAVASGEPIVTVIIGTATLTALDGSIANIAPGPTGYVCGGRVATIVGTNGPDKLKGTNGADVFVALGGDDKIEAGNGNDTICAGDGNDKVEGGGGTDYIDGGVGTDKCEPKRATNTNCE
jgi:Ca2+-binding RTX toxin-like protein